MLGTVHPTFIQSIFFYFKNEIGSGVGDLITPWEVGIEQNLITTK